ncbi:DUF5330 domain-containing protein [Gellertiella hungarica]|uniref:DUF5330 domain-containing protein n=1 Tax=Gellertiella hungarica TaxID=1572859 RepID=A0A7W6NLB4_9HYPH|nr:DUF5330 domain-containing protein [Gellertiella hungarica]MBB4065753.1 hypothetical protein [Gellertiella hungarica]
MWWLIKGSFWFSLVLVLLPLFNAGSASRLANAPPVEMADAFTAVTGAYTYLSGLCTEKPDVCEKGAKTFTALGYRAKEGAFVAYEYLNEKFADEPGKAAPSGEKTAALRPEKPLLAAGAEKDAAEAVEGGVAFQPMPGLPAGHKPQPYRPPVTDKVVTGGLPARVPVPLPRPYPES